MHFCYSQFRSEIALTWRSFSTRNMKALFNYDERTNYSNISVAVILRYCNNLRRHEISSRLHLLSGMHQQAVHSVPSQVESICTHTKFFSAAFEANAHSINLPATGHYNNWQFSATLQQIRFFFSILASNDYSRVSSSTTSIPSQRCAFVPP